MLPKELMEKFEENIKSLGGKITRYYEEESAEGIG